MIEHLPEGIAMDERPASTGQPRWPKFPEQNADGVDLSLIQRNLAMTPYERIVQAERFAEELAWIRAHARRIA